MPRAGLGVNVFDAAIMRMLEIYEGGHEVVVSFSAGKDSGVCLEVCRIAARQTNRLPVHVVMRDEEIMLPGTYEYADRVRQDPEVSFRWIVAHQPIINVFNRADPYWWVFDPLLDPERYVRPMPDYTEEIEEQHIAALITEQRYQPAEGKRVYVVMGLRADESQNRRMGIHSSGGHLMKPSPDGAGGFVSRVRPIYDWTDGDVWRAHQLEGWDYNHAYDVMHSLGLPKYLLRIAPPSMNADSIATMQRAGKAWPQWLSRVNDRLPGMKSAVQFGKRSVEARRRRGETWQETYQRECIDRAPDWIAARATLVRDKVLRAHQRHATTELPDVRKACGCPSWRDLTRQMYGGDPFGAKQKFAPSVEPEFFREGAGVWGGAASW